MCNLARLSKDETWGLEGNANPTEPYTHTQWTPTYVCTSVHTYDDYFFIVQFCFYLISCLSLRYLLLFLLNFEEWFYEGQMFPMIWGMRYITKEAEKNTRNCHVSSF